MNIVHKNIVHKRLGVAIRSMPELGPRPNSVSEQCYTKTLYQSVRAHEY